LTRKVRKESRQKYASPAHKPSFPAPENSRNTGKVSVKILLFFEIMIFYFEEEIN